MKIIVFTGPTIAAQEARNILDAIYFPPAKQGDIISVVYNERPDLIAIIDGTIFSQMPVWHKEILYALKNNVAVYGSSAIGALRAAEMNKFGMIGVGQVYQKFSTKELEDDDEVLFRFERNGNNQNGNSQYKRISEPMVNLRATFDEALHRGIIRPEEYTTLVSIAKGMYYPNRTFHNIFEQAVHTGLQEDRMAQLKHFVVEHYVDVQQRDAVELLDTIAHLTPSDLNKERKDIDDHPYGMLFYTLYDRDRYIKQDGGELPLYCFSNYVGLNHPNAEELNFHALNRKLTLLLADIFGIQVSQEDIEKEVNRFKRKYLLADNEVFEEWLSKNDLHTTEFIQLMQELACIRKTQQWYIMVQGFSENTKALLEELILNNEYPEWKEKAANREQLVQHHEDEIKYLFNHSDFWDLFKEHRQYQKFSWNVSPPDAAAETGIKAEHFMLELIKEKIARERIDSVVKDL